MEDVYQYPIFFECAGLDGERQKKTERYFTVSRKSGGGDCGSITNVHGDVYCISFNKREAQERVLQKSVHVLDFAGVPLVLTVRSTPGPSTDPPISSNATSKSLSPKLQPTSSQQTQPSSLTSGLLTRDEEYELRLDSHLLRYLNECPHAMKELDKGLSSVACSAQLYPEEDRVLVSRLAQAGAAVGNWRAEVDELFDGYLCHYEADPHKVKALLRPGTSRQAAGEKEKSTHRLGEAKLRLLWKKIEHRLRQDFPEVKVTRGDAGQIDLEGSVEEILKAGECISQHENLVLERTVSDMSHLLLAFLRKAYSGPGELGDFLGVGGKVEIELRDTAVRFFAFSADDLGKKIQEMFKEVVIDVANCSSLPADLCEKLKSKTIEMNQGQYRAEVVFGPGSTLRLLGHTKEVDELREVVIRSLDESGNKSIVHLPFPDLAERLPELLQAYAIDYTGVTFIPRTSSSGSTVVLHGPPGKGTEIRNFLEQYLDSYLEDLVPPSLSEVNTTVASYSLRDGCQVLVRQGDTTKQETDVLVNAANEDLEHTGGVAAALSKAGGPEVQKECRAIVKQRGKVASGDVVVTTGGNLNDPGFQMGATAGAPEHGDLVEIVHGFVETQQVDALVSPMVGHDPLSTRVGHTLLQVVGPQLTAQFQKEAEEETVPGDVVLVEGLPPLPSNAVFFVNLQPYDEDQDGTPVQILKLAISNILTSCDNRGFGSVALPVLGAGIALRFPGRLVATVLLEEVLKFKQNRASRTPFVVRVVIPPDDEESMEAFSYVQEPLQHRRLAKDVPQPDQVSNTRRIVLLGKTGYGKSHLANTIFGAQVFKTDHSPNSGTIECQAETQSVNGRSTTLIDTPGLFDTGKPEEVLKTDIVKCITECAPGPHAFLIVLKVEKFTEHELAVTKKICQYFTEEVLKYAVIVFTHGDDLPKGTTIAQFVRQNESLKDLVEKCGGRCHVVDNKRWTNKQKNNYRSNQARVEDLLNSIDEMVTQNNGGHYTNEMFQVVEKEIQVEEHRIQLKLSSGNMPREEIRKQAKVRVSEKLLIQLAGTATGALLGAFYGYQEMVRLVGAAVKKHSIRSEMVSALSGGGVPLAGKVVFAAAAGGYFGSKAAEGAKTPYEAAEMAKKAISDMRSAHST